ncbi:MAG: hypothetical protein QXL51_08215 [Candidatus Aenigmatarchaeota archaeon]
MASKRAGSDDGDLVLGIVTLKYIMCGKVFKGLGIEKQKIYTNIDQIKEMYQERRQFDGKMYCFKKIFLNDIDIQIYVIIWLKK